MELKGHLPESVKSQIVHELHPEEELHLVGRFIVGLIPGEVFFISALMPYGPMPPPQQDSKFFPVPITSQTMEKMLTDTSVWPSIVNGGDWWLCPSSCHSPQLPEWMMEPLAMESVQSFVAMAG